MSHGHSQFGSRLAAGLDKVERSMVGATRSIDDTAKAFRSVARSAAAFQDAARSVSRMQSAMDSFRMPTLEGSGRGAGPAAAGGALTAGLDDAASKAESVGRQIGAALASSLAPLANIGNTIGTQMQAIGATVALAAKRADATMRFPALMEQLDLAKEKLRGVSLNAAAAVGSFQLFSRAKFVLQSVFGGSVSREIDKLAKTNFATPTAGVGNLAAGFKALPGPVGAASSAVKGLGVQIGLAFGVGTLVFRAVNAIGGFVKAGISGASGLNETVSKTEQVFGGSAGAVKSLADDMARDFGAIKGDVLNAASSFGLIAKGAKLSQDEAADLAVAMTKLAADATSFYDVPLDDALEKIRAGLSGESEPLRAFGVLLNEDAVKAEALAMGLGKGKKTLDDHAKIMARASLISKGLADATGDLARTADSPANAFRRLTGMMSNLASTVGTAVLPTIGKGLAVLSGWATAATAFVDANKAAFASVAETIGAGVATGLGLLRDLGAGLAETFARTRAIVAGWGLDFTGTFEGVRGFVGGVVADLGMLFRNLPDFLEVAAIKISEVVTNIGATFAVLPANLATIARYIGDNWYKMIADSVSASQKVFENLAKNVGIIAQSIWDALNGKGFQFDPKALVPLLDGFKALTAELPELALPAFQSFQDQIDAKLDAIGRKEAELAGKMAEAAKQKEIREKFSLDGPAAGPGGERGEYKGTAALTFGSKEAASAIAKFRNGGDGDKDARITAQESLKQTTIQARMATALEKAFGPGTNERLSIVPIN